MKLKILLTVITVLFLYSTSLADHDCIEGINEGTTINLAKKFPEDWLTIGGKLITDPKLHSDLSSKFKDFYSTGEDEGYTGHSFCAVKDGIYIKVHTGKSDIETQSHAEFSTIPPKCYKCKRISKGTEYLTSKVGLKIGQSKTTVTEILSTIIKDDINTISFEEILEDDKTSVKHIQKLRLVFKKNKLIDFEISDFREQDN
jgi:hypothetical protein